MDRGAYRAYLEQDWRAPRGVGRTVAAGTRQITPHGCAVARRYMRNWWHRRVPTPWKVAR